jgi:hypothetical protein
MKTSTSLLLVNRLLNSSFTLTFLLLTFFVSAQTVNTNSALYAANSYETVSTGIEYASLSATATEKAVLINWVTASEQNNSHFEVERSLDMKVFKTVAMVLDGFAAEGTGKKYKFKEDAGTVNKGKTVYYRLKQVGTDYQVSYSEVMAVQKNTIVTVFPKKDASIVKPNTSNRKVSGVAEVLHSNTDGQILLSKQSDMGFKNVSAEKVKLSAGIFNARVLMNKTLIINPKLVFA